MLSYEKFKQLWKDEDLDAETFLLSTYWNSVFSEKELCFVIQVIQKSRETNTFADFLRAIDLLPSEFSETFDLGIDRVNEWMVRKTIFPERLKSRYVFELISNEIEKIVPKTIKKFYAELEKLNKKSR